MKLKLRKYPYPYRALFAICSDLDETPNEALYFETCRYLNTGEVTVFGPGVDLEVGNTIYFGMPEGQFSYWNCSDSGRNNIHKLIQSGHIDCLHSFGDLIGTREQVQTCLDELSSQGSNIRVWVDHAAAPSNFDPTIMHGGGALKGSPIYHADETISDYGVKYVWKGRVTSVIAQNSPRSMAGIFNQKNAIVSLKTVAIEFVKGVLGALGNKKYRMHAANKVLRKTNLTDGTPVYEFMRSNPSWAGVSCFEKGKDIDKVLTEKALELLIKKEGCSILYTHLGKIQSLSEPFSKAVRSAFERLSYKYTSGQLLVMTTQRLLDYLTARDALRYYAIESNGVLQIHVDCEEEEYVGLPGMTWYVDDPEKVELFVAGKLVNDLSRNAKDYMGRKSVSIPLEKLKFPALESL